MPPADPELIATIRAGHPDWSMLSDQYRDAMERRARRLLTASNYMVDESILGESAEDIVEQVLIELFERGIPRDVKSLASYLNRCVANRTKDLLDRARFDQPFPDPEVTRLAPGTSTGLLRPTPNTKRTTTSPPS